jgi:transposase-like protein
LILFHGKTVKKVAADLKDIYTACNENQAAIALANFRTKWDKISNYWCTMGAQLGWHYPLFGLS